MCVPADTSTPVWTAVLCLLVASAASGDHKPARGEKFRAGTIEAPAIVESSGIVASRRHDGVFWTINDSGNPPAIYAITRDGRLIREYSVAARNIDWEDLASDDDGNLYIADVGNNSIAGRSRSTE